MNTYRDRGVTCTSDLLEGGGGPGPVLFRLTPNGHPAPSSDPTTLTRVSVPKMGVRARIAEWPPRRAQSRESLLENGQGSNQHGDDSSTTTSSVSVPVSDVGLVRGGVARLPRRRTKDAEFRGGSGGDRGSPVGSRSFPPLRQRSSSEVTLSEQDENEVEGRGGASLYREYGSTSSIDVQGIPEQSFFDMLSQFHQERPDQRSTAPVPLGELLRAPDAAPYAPLPAGHSLTPAPRSETRARKKSGGAESSLGTSSLFRKLRSSSRGELDKGETGEDGGGRGSTDAPYKPWVCPKSFVHYDAQSILFDLHEASAQQSLSAQRRNTATGASAASVSLTPSRSSTLSGLDASFSSAEDLTLGVDPAAATPFPNRDPMDPSGGPGSSQLLLSCPHFCNETGGLGERNVSFLSSSAERGGEGGAGLRRSNASVSVLEVAVEQQVTRLDALKLHSIEHVDLGSRYYREYFHGKEHSNYFGTDEKLGPVAVSIRREKLDDTKDLKDQYQYRIIGRTSELVTLRGSILEDAVASTARHGSVRGLPLKEVLEQVLPEFSVSCLRLALSTPKVTEQLLKLDEQGLSQKHKVGLLLCRAGQSTEEEMYNNEEATPAFCAFMAVLGEQVCLRGFTKYAAQLDTKTDSTGSHSLYTTYQGYEVMFHVSTMLPYMPNNPQQLLRKRHIGNDIVTIIFQEPGALPFTPQNIRSHFQHVFIIVRVHNPCSDNTCYSVAVTRMKDVPPFGPPIPSGVTFRDPEAFRNFLLAKVINAENAAHKSEKFHTMATRTRQEYLRDLAENCVSSTPLDSAGKLNNLISLASKKRERARAREGAELGAAGAVAWRVMAQDFSGGGTEISCALGVSAEYILLADCHTKEVVFNCFCADVIGWTPERLSLKIFYGRGDHIAVRVPEGYAQDVREMVQRLKALTVGCETVDMTLRRNGLGQLGFHVRLDGTVAEVEEYGFAWQAGLRQGSRLVEICKVAAVTLTHEQMIDLLRTSVTVKVVIIPPYEEGGPRRGCTEEYEMKNLEQKTEPEPVGAGYRPSPRPPAWRWDSPPAPPGPQGAPTPQRWTPVGLQPPLPRSHKTMAPIPYREPQHLSKRPVSFPENHYSLSPAGGGLPYRNPSASFSSPSSMGGLAALGAQGLSGPFVRYKPSPDRFGTAQRPLLAYEPQLSLDVSSSGESSSGFTSQDSTIERSKTEPLWHVPVPSSQRPGGGGQRRPIRQDVPGKDSPNRHSKGETQYSSHSSSNTLSSNASSSHSDERWFDGGAAERGGPGGSGGCLGDPADPDPDPHSKGGSSDSGIDAPTLYNSKPSGRHGNQSTQLQRPAHGSAAYNSGVQDAAGAKGNGVEGRRLESSPVLHPSASQTKGYRTRTFPPPGSSAEKPDSFRHRACYTPQGYKTPAAENSRPVRSSTVTPNSALLCSSSLSTSAPKTLYSRTGAWQPEGSTPSPLNTPGTYSSDSIRSKKQVDVNSKNVFGQPRLRASLRDLRSPRRSHKSTVEDDLKKLIIMDNPGESPQRDTSPRRTLQRTFSDESLCSGRRDASYANSAPLFEQGAPSDLLFTCTLPIRRHGHSSNHMNSKKVPLSASELSLTEVRDKVPPLRRLDPGLMPLPDTACGLEWASLVSAAKAYEVQRAVSLFTLSDPKLGVPDIRPIISPVQFQTPQTPRTTPTFSGDEVPNDLSGRLYSLEVMLKQLNNDLEKEKEDKVHLLAEMAHLRENNQRLQEESQSASEQLRKFSMLFTEPPERK
ncbi:signal-induced proliferation-associated 1-like protein 3 isoform X1 [Esox lucius]|uniref:signal-induced proliferation-associated 1-like protein 3 isoform X1 n=1 Tax=Esox lucius TaxID=8010 RepID=UPI001476C2F4|nr:signal-induced proliferation-associated 1-like protein 3 isoform X1 [Esox lucius]XP_034148475.1 signal-induced proliferation-associated 1-like protein 3 isoform X1 [Esox lucius]XP_034148479.1 signal-induced proliferation-associated 1-like protein 3 isoform X1 [Esox lucius]XP_034148482.1 signal-induced proliferation-associated 1-like protein 3 isoform X1 [Esox lucius]XP_034148484.1 signal-induced proliferation-associated 1-like protein 3 isoform X1 [Esox lucius]